MSPKGRTNRVGELLREEIAKLIGKGYKVAVCEQLEDPKTAKGVVKRDVVRIITPGVVVDPAILLGELGKLKQRGILKDPSRIRVSGRAHVLLPWHCALDKARDVDELQRRRHDFGRLFDFRELQEPLVRNRDNACVRLYSTEREICGCGRPSAERIEYCRFADVRQPDESA